MLNVQRFCCFEMNKKIEAFSVEKLILNFMLKSVLFIQCQITGAFFIIR